MSGRELADRLRQHATARLDFVRHKSGMGFELDLLDRESARAEPHFFFSSGSVANICSRLLQLLPSETDDIIERAERICDHRFDLLAYKELDYGPEIDWHYELVHKKRAPKKPWFEIHYLDFAEVGDCKITWELNRHQHLVTLAKAYRLTGEEKFAGEAFRQWQHWHWQNPYPIGINWVSSLEVAFRSLSWLWMYFLMSDTPAMPSGFRAELCRSLGIAGRHIDCYLSTYFSPNTHLLGEGVALFFIGTLCPELNRAKRWQQRGWEIVQHESERQVRNDGLHFEQSTYYHVYALDFFLHATILASLNGITIPPQMNRKIELMLEALCFLGRSGPVPGLGDDDGGRLFNPQRNRSGHLLDPLATGAVLFTRGDFKAFAGGVREEMLWLVGEAGMAEFDRLPVAPAVQGSKAFENSGLYVMADVDLGRQLVIDAGPQGAGSAGHGHADALSVTASFSGRAMLIDSGTFEYLGPESERNRFRGSKAHNTLVIDGLDQCEPKGPFSWDRQTDARAEGWINGETFDLFAGSHDGYTRLSEPVVHRRFVFSRKGCFWLVRDQALGQGQHELELFWHIAPEFLPIEEVPAAFRSATSSLSILAPENHGWSRDMLLQDWSPAYGAKKKHSVLRFRTAARLPAEFATLLFPTIGIKTGGKSFVCSSSLGTEKVIGYRFETADEEHHMFFGQGKEWETFPWGTDAEFLYWGQIRDKAQRVLVCCNASYVEANGQRVMSSSGRNLRCEIISEEGRVRVISSGREAVVSNEAFDMISVERANI